MSKKRTDRLKADAVGLRHFILENIFYDPDEGALYMRGSPRMRLPVEPEDNGKRPRVRIMGQPVLAAHVAYVAKTKDWPKLPLRHLNGDEKDIRWRNLVVSNAMSDEEQDEALIRVANDRFLADLRSHHPLGPPTYTIKSGKPIVFYQYRAQLSFGGSPAGMCADMT